MANPLGRQGTTKRTGVFVHALFNHKNEVIHVRYCEQCHKDRRSCKVPCVNVPNGRCDLCQKVTGELPPDE